MSHLEKQKRRTCSGQEIQFLALTTRGPEVKASGLEDQPMGDWLLLMMDRAETRQGMGGRGCCHASGDP